MGVGVARGASRSFACLLGLLVESGSAVSVSLVELPCALDQRPGRRNFLWGVAGDDVDAVNM